MVEKLNLQQVLLQFSMAYFASEINSILKDIFGTNKWFLIKPGTHIKNVNRIFWNNKNTCIKIYINWTNCINKFSCFYIDKLFLTWLLFTKNKPESKYLPFHHFMPSLNVSPLWRKMMEPITATKILTLKHNSSIARPACN